jgi:hypothetical protein
MVAADTDNLSGNCFDEHLDPPVIQPSFFHLFNESPHRS